MEQPHRFDLDLLIIERGPHIIEHYSHHTVSHCRSSHVQIITLKVDPQFADAFRHDFDTITVEHYVDKRHWISIGAGAGITTQLIEDLIRMFHDLATPSRR